MLSDEILFSSVGALGRAIRARTLSPVELTESYLARLETIGRQLNAVVTVTRDLALRQASAAEKEIAAGTYRGPLHGIPYGLKDAFATRGVPTTWGAAPYKDRVLDYDAAVATRLADAGAVLLGKLALVELVGGLGYNSPDASFTGAVGTPWNVGYWAGGSSTGPGAATSAALVAFSIGSETGGSILNPSTHCGLAGLRPTYGRVSRYGAAALCWTLDKVGPMCRSASDCGIVLKAVAGYDPRDRTTSRRTFSDPAPVRGRRRLRLGVIKGSFERAQPEVRANFERSLGVLSGIAEVIPDVDFPDYPYGPILSTILGAEGASAYRELVDSGRMRELQSQGDRVGGYIGSMISAVDYLQAMRVRVVGRRALDTLLAKYDALVAPTMSAVSGPLTEQFDRRARPRPADAPAQTPVPAVIPAGNIAGVPAITVPNGFGQHGIPTGLQFLGRAWSEATLIAIADAYQQITDWHTRRPDLTRLSARPAQKG